MDIEPNQRRLGTSDGVHSPTSTSPEKLSRKSRLSNPGTYDVPITMLVLLRALRVFYSRDRGPERDGGVPPLKPFLPHRFSPGRFTKYMLREENFSSRFFRVARTKSDLTGT